MTALVVQLVAAGVGVGVINGAGIPITNEVAEAGSRQECLTFSHHHLSPLAERLRIPYKSSFVTLCKRPPPPPTNAQRNTAAARDY
jgi:hypothetical protein